MSGVINIFTNAFSAVSSWFTEVIDATGMGPVFLAAVFLVVLFRRLITPIFGQAGSDRARRSKNSEVKE